MKKNSYEIMLSVFEKQNNGVTLEKDERMWKQKYMKNRVDSVKDVDGVKVTRYRPNWEKNTVL
jgi:hypothetical protein